MPDQAPFSQPSQDANQEVDQHKSEDQERLESIDDGQMPDGMLRVFHDLGEQNIGIGVTIFINGQTVSGNLCSGAEFARQMLPAFGDGEEGSLAANLRTYLQDYIDEHEEIRLKPAGANNFEFIHFRNARIFLPGADPIPKAGGYMRFRAQAVVGWIFGTLSKSDR